MDAKREQRTHTVLRCLSPLLAVVTVGSLLWTLRTLLRGGLEPGDTAGVVAVPLAALAAWLGTVAILKRRSTPEAAAARLAGLVLGAERAALAQLLGDGTPVIDARFRTPGAQATPDAPATPGFPGSPATPGDASPRTGAVDHFRTLRPQRVMITGEPGAGKTMLAIQLMLALLDSRKEHAPVPVRLSATAWEPERPFDVWFAEQISRLYALSAAEARELVMRRLAMPVVDGVDEMGDTHAAALLDQLSSDRRNMNQRPMIVTCRSEPYERLREGSHPLADAHHLAVEPLTAAQAGSFLADHPRVRPNAERWEPVLAGLRAAPDGPLAQGLASPWRLTLAVAAYARDPADMVGRAATGDLYGHMLSRYIPATVRLHFAEEDERAYAEEDVERWLSELAWHVGLGGTGSDQDAVTVQEGRHDVARFYEVRASIADLGDQALRALATYDGTTAPPERLREAANWAEARLAELDTARRQRMAQFQQRLRSDGHVFDGIALGRLWSMAGPRRIRTLDALIGGSVALIGAFSALVALRGWPSAGTAWYGHPALWAVAVASGVAWLSYRQEVQEPLRLDVRSLWRGRGRRRLVTLLGAAALRLLAAPGLIIVANEAASALGAPRTVASVAAGLAGTVSFALLMPWAVYWSLVLPVVRTVALLYAVLTVAVGGIVGVAAGYTDAPVSEVVAGAGAIAVVPAIGWFLARRIESSEPDPGATRRRNPRGGMLGEVVRGTAQGMGLAAANCWALALQPPAIDLVDVTVTSLAVTGASITCSVALLRMPSARRYLLALLCLRGRLPFRLGRFVKWAYGAGLLRAADLSYQFRHQELHEWLLTSYYAGNTGPMSVGYVSPPR
ncbi:NACHT domain-containing protein [Streptomyces microflavus]|uniref:NACHT domain-containing protein n=1 Tax=Streptomyces microflavus TaxID=1919 RepID=UPI0036EE66CB